jgi:hypothetical protein
MAEPAIRPLNRRKSIRVSQPAVGCWGLAETMVETQLAPFFLRIPMFSLPDRILCPLKKHVVIRFSRLNELLSLTVCGTTEEKQNGGHMSHVALSLGKFYARRIERHYVHTLVKVCRHLRYGKSHQRV